MSHTEKYFAEEDLDLLSAIIENDLILDRSLIIALAELQRDTNNLNKQEAFLNLLKRCYKKELARKKAIQIMDAETEEN